MDNYNEQPQNNIDCLKNILCAHLDKDHPSYKEIESTQIDEDIMQVRDVIEYTRERYKNLKKKIAVLNSVQKFKKLSKFQFEHKEIIERERSNLSNWISQQYEIFEKTVEEAMQAHVEKNDGTEFVFPTPTHLRFDGFYACHASLEIADYLTGDAPKNCSINVAGYNDVTKAYDIAVIMNL